LSATLVGAVAERISYAHPEDPNVVIDTDLARVDFDFVHAYLTRSYWCEGISLELVVRAATNSLIWGVYNGETQIGYARVITDRTTFAWLCDVFIIESEQKKGYGEWLVRTVVKHPALTGLRRFGLGTRDAHTLYEKVGFRPIAQPERLMEILNRDVYAATKK